MLDVAGDFDYIVDYLNNGTITTTAFNLDVDVVILAMTMRLIIWIGGQMIFLQF